MVNEYNDEYNKDGYNKDKCIIKMDVYEGKR